MNKDDKPSRMKYVGLRSFNHSNVGCVRRLGASVSEAEWYRPWREWRRGGEGAKTESLTAETKPAPNSALSETAWSRWR
jgi:hypothetical protein